MLPPVDAPGAFDPRDVVVFPPELVSAAGRIAGALPATVVDGPGVLEASFPIGDDFFAVSPFACAELTLAPADLFDAPEGGAATRAASVAVAVFPGVDSGPRAF